MKKKQCWARILLGEKLRRTWATCELRYNGLCCNDCPRVEDCSKKCLLYLIATVSKGTCVFYLSLEEAVFKKVIQSEA